MRENTSTMIIFVKPKFLVCIQSDCTFLFIHGDSFGFLKDDTIVLRYVSEERLTVSIIALFFTYFYLNNVYINFKSLLQACWKSYKLMDALFVCVFFFSQAMLFTLLHMRLLSFYWHLMWHIPFLLLNKTAKKFFNFTHQFHNSCPEFRDVRNKFLPF